MGLKQVLFSTVAASARGGGKLIILKRSLRNDADRERLKNHPHSRRASPFTKRVRL